MLSQPVFQPRAQVAQSERAGGAVDQISLCQGIEVAAAQHGSKAREILCETGENAKPVLPVVDFQPLEGSEAIVGLDELSGDNTHGPSVWSDRAHAFGGREGRHDCASHASLEVEELHTAVARQALVRNLSAFKASSRTSSNDGMRSSHSSRVAVWPARLIASAYNFQTGSMTG